MFARHDLVQPLKLRESNAVVACDAGDGVQKKTRKPSALPVHLNIVLISIPRVGNLTAVRSNRQG